MKRIAAVSALAAALLVLTGPCLPASDTTRIVNSPPTSGKNAWYVGNRPPLISNPLIKLPIGSIKPEGWLREQLALMADGFTGRLPELSTFCKFEGNAWVSPAGEGENGWEEVPYWLKGFGDLGYVLGNKKIVAEAKGWIEGMLKNQRPDGYFGPEANRRSMDLWPNMPAMHALRSWHEYSGDRRVLNLMSRYFKWQTTVPLENLLPGSWQKVRGGDNLDSIYWLYNRTGDGWLLELARVIHERTVDWSGRVASWHGVNIAQGFREPAQYYQQVRDIRYLKAAERNYDEVMRKYGQVPGGGFGADENCREGYYGPRQGTETCTWVELMYSHEMLAAITGEVKWLDRCEEIAFNSLPASMTPDLKGLHYITCPNQIQLDRANKSPDIQNGGDMFSYNPYDYRCCQHNAAMGWPYFAEHLWMATRDNGLAACLYSECSVTAKVGSGQSVTIAEKTAYPFDGTVVIRIESLSKPCGFSIYLRIPGWCDEPAVDVNSKPVTVPPAAQGWIMLNRKWRSGDVVRLRLPMKTAVKTWERNRNAVSVYRGPLAYSLKIEEDWRRYGKDNEWDRWEVFPGSPWNYGLVLDSKDPAASVRVARTAARLPSQPFAAKDAPVELKARARRIAGWKQQDNGMPEEIEPSPIISKEPIEEVTLIPMGCARLRLTAFPTIGDGPDTQLWGAAKVTATASHVADSISALNDGILPSDSTDQRLPRFTWWPRKGTREWVQYDFGAPRKLSWSAVYWYDDKPIGGGCWQAKSWRLFWWDGQDWQPVENTTPYKATRDEFNRVEFKQVLTDKLRMEVQFHPNVSCGILEWRIGN